MLELSVLEAQLGVCMRLVRLPSTRDLPSKNIEGVISSLIQVYRQGDSESKLPHYLGEDLVLASRGRQGVTKLPHLDEYSLVLLVIDVKQAHQLELVVLAEDGGVVTAA